jgi:hypothetical protein
MYNGREGELSAVSKALHYRAVAEMGANCVIGRLSIIVVLAAICSILATCAVADRSNRQEMCWVWVGPATSDTQRGPWQLNLFQSDSSVQSLEAAWTSARFSDIRGVRVYPELQSILMIEGYPA